MTNSSIIININPKIVRYVPTGVYYMYIPAFMGYDASYAYGVYMVISDIMSITHEGLEIAEFFTELKYAASKTDKTDFYNLLYNGTSSFVCGKDYFLSESLETFVLSNINIEQEPVQDDTDTGADTEPQDDTEEQEEVSKSMPDFVNAFNERANMTLLDDIMDTDLEQFIRRNEIAFYTDFTEEELNNIPKTFFTFIQKYGDYATDPSAVTNMKYQIYKRVIDYYAAGQQDDTAVNLSMIFESGYYPNDLNYSIVTSNTNNCSCASSGTGTSGSSSAGTTNANGTTYDLSSLTSCLGKYQAAMFEYLKMMLADTDFYCWFVNYYDEDGSINTELLNLLIKLLSDFLGLGYDLSADGSAGHCNCASRNLKNKPVWELVSDGHDVMRYAVYTPYDTSNAVTGSNTNCSNYKIIDNYIQVLKWGLEDKICLNKNKVYVYGRDFANLLPGLVF